MTDRTTEVIIGVDVGTTAVKVAAFGVKELNASSHALSTIIGWTNTTTQPSQQPALLASWAATNVEAAPAETSANDH